jgi:two-component system, NarL family, response regulator DevR
VADEPDNMIRVFLLDDQDIVRLGLRTLLELEPDIIVVGEGRLASDAPDRIAAARADVAVLDARLPDGSGIDVCREVRSRGLRTACLMLTSYDDDDDALISAIMAGAAGYLLKMVDSTTIVDAVRRLAAGQSLLDPAVTQAVLARLRQFDPRPTDPLGELSDQERRVLNLVTEGLTNRDIADRMYVSEKTVKNYVSSLLAKLGMASRTQAAVFAATHSSEPRARSM